MADNRMLQRILDNQTVMMDGLVKLDKKLDKVEEKLTKRIDKIGKSLACLEDDAPTRDEFDDLEKRVDKIENRIIV